MSAVEIHRKIPRRRRAKASVDCVLEAAAQVLEAAGDAGFNTNAVAERAGVSIGTLYRYFPNKNAILIALAEREREAHRHGMIAVIEGEQNAIARDRAMIRAFLRAFAGRAQARRIAVSALLAQSDANHLAENFPVAEMGLAHARGEPLNKMQAFVLSRALHGAMRAAVLEGVDFLLSQDFEDELVRLGRLYLGYTHAKPD